MLLNKRNTMQPSSTSDCRFVRGSCAMGWTLGGGATAGGKAKSSDGDRDTRKLAMQLRRLPIEIANDILFVWARPAQPQPLLRDIEHFGRSFPEICQTYEVYWVSMTLFTQYEALRFLENDVFRFFNNDRPMMRGLTRKFYDIMLRLKCFHGSRALVEKTFGLATWFRKWQRRGAANDIPLKIVFLWGLLRPNEREEFATLFGVARRKTQYWIDG